MMKIGNLLVFGTIMDFSNVEAARKMVSGGIVRQCMRLCKHIYIFSMLSSFDFR